MKKYLIQLIDNDIESVQRHLISVNKYITERKTDEPYYYLKVSSLTKKITKLEGYKEKIAKSNKY